MSSILACVIFGFCAYLGWCTAVAIKRFISKKLDEKKTNKKGE